MPRRAYGVTEMEDFPDGWEDSIVVGSIRRNRDGSLSISCQIDVVGKAESWTTNRIIRLEKSR